MSLLYLSLFHALRNSTAPAFQSTASDTAVLLALESTSLREWQFATSRAVRLAEKTGADYYVKFGTSDVVAASTNSMLILGGTVEAHRVDTGQTHISLYSSTDVTVNICLGTGQ
jgi:hypothetical protein